MVCTEHITATSIVFWLGLDSSQAHPSLLRAETEGTAI